MKFVVVGLVSAALLFGCASGKPKFGKNQCAALSKLALAISMQITQVANPDRAPLVAEYLKVVESLAEFGCSFVPLTVGDVE